MLPNIDRACSTAPARVYQGVTRTSAQMLLQLNLYARMQWRFIAADGVEMPLEEGTSAFITMNPGYIGRAELPESLKALFRPITVVVPDRQLIMENMLMAEGFETAKMLAKKFAALYYLLEDLLSPQKHYDWGLRAIKSVLVVAGSLLRAEAGQDEADVLFRALRDFNIPKILNQDMVIFMGLLSDLFPGTDPPRKRDMTFEQVIVDETVKAGLTPESDFILRIVQGAPSAPACACDLLCLVFSAGVPSRKQLVDS